MKGDTPPLRAQKRIDPDPDTPRACYATLSAEAVGLRGAKNFTADFSQTAEYKKIAGLGYVDIRYPTNNLFGVRFEP